MYVTKQQKIQAKRRRRRLIFFSALILLVIGAAVLLIVNGVFGGSKRKLKALPMTSQAQYSFTGEGFVYIQSGTLSYADLRDSAKDWTVNVSSEQVKLASSKTVCAVYNEMAVQFMDIVKGQKLFTREYPGVLELVRCAAQYVGILRRDDAQNHQLYINGLSGNDVYELKFDSNIEVLDFGFYGPSDTLWTLTLNTAGVSPNIKLETHSIEGQSITGAMTVEGQLAEHIEFRDKSTYIIGTNHFIAYNDLGKEESRVLIYGWKYADFGVVGNKPVLIVTPRGTDGVSGAAKIITLPGEEQLLQLPANVCGIFVVGGKYVVVTNGALRYYSDKGELLEEQALDILVDSARKISDSQLMLRRGGEEFLVTIS